MAEGLVLLAPPLQSDATFAVVDRSGAKVRDGPAYNDRGGAAASGGCYATMPVSQQMCLGEDPQMMPDPSRNSRTTLTDLILCFLLSLIVACHRAHTARACQRYSRALWATLLILPVFILCLLPSNILLVLTYSDGDGKEPFVTYMVSLAFSSYNSCTDPGIFYFVSADFRDKASRVLCCHSTSEDSPNHTETMCHILHRGQKCS